MASSTQNITMSVHDLSSENPSICIPRTFSNVTWQLVKDAFDEIFGIGYVERVDVINKTDNHNNEYKKIFIHFTKWPETDYAKGVKKALLDGKTIKVVYQYPWYWKCVMSNVPKRNWNGRKPYIEFDDNTSEGIKTADEKNRLFSQRPYDNRHVLAAQAIQDVDGGVYHNHSVAENKSFPAYQPAGRMAYCSRSDYGYNIASSTDLHHDMTLRNLEEGGAGFDDGVPSDF